MVIDDADLDDFYDIGEGLGEVSITATGAAGTFQTTSFASGGYALELPAGSYDVTFSGGALGGDVVGSATLGSENVKFDAIAQDAVTDDFSADPDTTGTVAVGGAATGVIEVGQDRDWFAVQLLAGTTYVIEQRGAPTGEGTLTDPRLRLYDATGALVGENDDAGVGFNARLEVSPGSSGTFFVGAGAFSPAATGSYTVAVESLETGNAPPVAVADSATTFVGTPVTVPVLANDSDPEGGPLDLVSVAVPSGWLAAVEGDNLRVVPPLGVSGETVLGYTVADDQGAESEGALTIDVRPQAFPQGVVRGTPQGDPILIGQNAAYIGLGGGDRFVISQAVEPGGISLVEFMAGDAAQLVPGLEIVGGRLRPDSVEFTLANGAKLRLLQADIATFDIGGNATLGRTGTLTDYAGMAQSLFGVAPPASGERAVGPATIADPAALSDGLLTLAMPSATSASNIDSAMEGSMDPPIFPSRKRRSRWWRRPRSSSRSVSAACRSRQG